MIKVLSAIVISFLVFSSCHKGGCDPGMMNPKFDVAVYRGPDMRPEADYVSIDGSQQAVIPTPESSNVNCAIAGILHYSLPLGTHTVTISYGMTAAKPIAHTLILSKSGATLDGTALASQSCNGGLSALIEDI